MNLNDHDVPREPSSATVDGWEHLISSPSTTTQLADRRRTQDHFATDQMKRALDTVFSSTGDFLVVGSTGSGKADFLNWRHFSQAFVRDADAQCNPQEPTPLFIVLHPLVPTPDDQLEEASEHTGST